LLGLGGLVDPVGRGAGVPLAASNDARDEAVGRDGGDGSDRREDDSWEREGVHLVVCDGDLGLIGRVGGLDELS